MYACCTLECLLDASIHDACITHIFSLILDTDAYICVGGILKETEGGVEDFYDSPIRLVLSFSALHLFVVVSFFRCIFLLCIFLCCIFSCCISLVEGRNPYSDANFSSSEYMLENVCRGSSLSLPACLQPP